MQLRQSSLLLCVVWVMFSCGTALADPVSITVYGATGRVGARVVGEALSRGHLVTSVSRNPSPGIRQGDILDPASVRELVAGQDVVVVSVRGSVDGSKDPEQAIQRVAAEVMVEVLRELGSNAPRLIYVGGAGTLEVEPGIIYAETLGGLAKAMMPASVEQEIAGQVLTLDYFKTIGDVRWTYISPAKKFSPGDRTGEYRLGGGTMLLDERGRSKISMEDFAVALVDEIENVQHIHKHISVAY